MGVVNILLGLYIPRSQNEILDVFVWLFGLIVVIFLPNQKKPHQKLKMELNLMNDINAFYAKCFKLLSGPPFLLWPV